MDKSDTYLGDGLYASYDGWQFRLYASDGIRVTNEVFLEPEVLEAMFRFIERTRNLKITVEALEEQST